MGSVPCHRPHRGRPRSSSGSRHRRRVPRPRSGRVWPDQSRCATGELQSLFQGVHEAPWHSHGRLRHVHRSCCGPCLHRTHGCAHRGQGRRPGCRQGRGGGAHLGRSARSSGLHAGRQQIRRATQRGWRSRRDRGISGRRRSQLHRGVRRQNRASPGHVARPQAPARRRPRPQHGRHGRLFARARGHAGRS